MLNPMLIPMAIHLFFPGAPYLDDHALLTMVSSELPKSQTPDSDSSRKHPPHSKVELSLSFHTLAMDPRTGRSF